LWQEILLLTASPIGRDAGLGTCQTVGGMGDHAPRRSMLFLSKEQFAPRQTIYWTAASKTPFREIDDMQNGMFDCEPAGGRDTVQSTKIELNG
jgi:hypothetical protein